MGAVDLINVVRIVRVRLIVRDDARTATIGTNIVHYPVRSIPVAMGAVDLINVVRIVRLRLIVRDDARTPAIPAEITDQACQSSTPTVWAIYLVDLDQHLVHL